MRFADLLSQSQETFWGRPSGTTDLYMRIGLALVVGFALMYFLLKLPSRARRWVVAAFTFVAGLFYVLVWLWPKAQDRGPADLPLNATEGVAFWLQDAVGRVGNLASILTAFLLGLGVYSLLRIHFGRLRKKHPDWMFSVVLLVAMFGMAFIGYWDWYVTKFSMADTDFNVRENWVVATYTRDLLFDGVLQKMDAAMFSIIAFYIMSAAYRAFRVRSVEATILLATALIVMLSLLALVDLASNNMVTAITGGDPNHVANNLKMSELYAFIRAAFQSPSIRAIDFGIGVGALAMGLRLWLSLDRGGATS